MKKFFTSVLLLFAVAATASYADTPQKMLPIDHVVKKLDAKVGEASEITNPVQHVAASDDISADTWTSVGIGKFTDPVCPIYGFEAGPWEVEIEQSNEHQGYYRLVNPYGTSKWGYYNSSYLYSDEDSYITLDCSNPDSVKLVTTYSVSTGTASYGMTLLNLSVDSDDGVMFLVDWGGASGHYGKMVDSNITIPKDYLAIFMYGSRYLYSAGGDFNVSLPGAKDYSLDVKVEKCCYANNVIPFSITAGKDAPIVKVSGFTSTYGRLSVNSSYSSAVAQRGQTLNGSGPFSFNLSSAPDGCWFSVYGVTCDTLGNVLNADVDYAFVSHHVDSLWRDLGMTKFVDDTFARPFLGTTDIAEEREVQLLQNKQDPTRFRLVNAFATSSLEGFDASTMYEGTGNDLNYYTEIIIYPNDSVGIPDRPMGLTIKGYKLSLLDNGSGKLNADRTITFDTDSLFVCSGGGSYWYANRSGKFSLLIPRYDIIAVVTDLNDQPVAGATVKVGDYTATTDDTGSAIFSAFNIGTTSATFTATYKDTAADKTRSGSATIDLEDGSYDLFVPIVLTVETGIDNIKVDAVDDANAPLYDLTGRRISKPAQHGVYIKGGKKVVY
jgi:hypothetical protein